MVTPAAIEPKRISQTQSVVWSAIVRDEFDSRTAGDPTDSPQLSHTKPIILENPGNRFTLPQCGHRSLVTSSVDSISSSVRCRSVVGIVRTTASHTLDGFDRRGRRPRSANSVRAIGYQSTGNFFDCFFRASCQKGRSSGYGTVAGIASRGSGG
jgi:hypothetical protein